MRGTCGFPLAAGLLLWLLAAPPLAVLSHAQGGPGAGVPGGGKGWVTLPTAAAKLRVIATFPDSTAANTRNALESFRVSEIVPKNGAAALELEAPVLIEEYPFSDFVVKSNKSFGVQLAGQVNPRLARSKYRGPEDFNRGQERIMELFSLAGVGIARDFQSYDARRPVIEPAPGRYDFRNLDFLAALSDKYGIDVIARFSMHSELFKAGPPDDMESYRRYVGTTVERYDGDAQLGCTVPAPDCYTTGDRQYPVGAQDAASWAAGHRIRYWETVKEPEPGRRTRPGNDPGLTPPQVAEIFRASYEEIKSRDPGASVFFAGMGPVSGSFDPREKLAAEKAYFEEILKRGGGKHLDVLGVDAYVFDVVEVSSEYRRLAGAHGLAPPLWVGQTGAPDIPSRLPFGGSPQRQSAYLVQTFTRAFATGVEKVLWGEALDCSGAEGRPPNLWDATGLFATDTGKLKPVYFTYKLMATALRDFRKVEQIAPNLFRFSFADRSPLYVAWP